MFILLLLLVGTGCQVGDTVDDETNVVVGEEVGIEGISGISHYQVTHVMIFGMNVCLTLRKIGFGFGFVDFLSLGKRLDACARVVVVRRGLVGLVVTVEEAVGAYGDHCLDVVEWVLLDVLLVVFMCGVR